ncbi:MAG: GntG family PLP-dependent aldolase [Thermoanaerobaculia bacterium]|nr:GntG family PLP-dependent aldolase [Thermoanaerobaculia bacterium]
MNSIDLRSDTVTRPDATMRRAMAEAEVGDDVFAEDPTVRRLEETTAELLGHEAGLFVPSGTMGNQIGLHLHARPGSEVICDSRSHVVFYEMGALAALSGLLPRTIETAWGQLEPGAVESLIAPDVSYRARTALVLVENSHNVCGGTVYTPEQLDAVVGVARRRGLPVHLDGARLWNAAVAAGVPESRFSAGVDTVNVCLSKGLGAPVGSVLCGSAERMKEARRVRKMFGGGMRQVGVLAAAGLVALGNRARLATDHEHARLLAETLAELPGTVVDLDHVVTNIVVFGITAEFFRGGLASERDPIDEFLARLADRGVRAVRISPTRARFTTHGDVDRAGIEAAVAAIRALAA